MSLFHKRKAVLLVAAVFIWAVCISTAIGQTGSDPAKLFDPCSRLMSGGFGSQNTPPIIASRLKIKMVREDGLKKRALFEHACIGVFDAQNRKQLRTYPISQDGVFRIYDLPDGDYFLVFRFGRVVWCMAEVPLKISSSVRKRTELKLPTKIFKDPLCGVAIELLRKNDLPIDDDFSSRIKDLDLDAGCNDRNRTQLYEQYVANYQGSAYVRALALGAASLFVELCREEPLARDQVEYFRSAIPQLTQYLIDLRRPDSIQ